MPSSHAPGGGSRGKACDGGATSYSLAILYACAFFYSLRRLLLLRRRRKAWDAPRLFVASVCFACLLRTASFGALAGLAFAKVAVAPSSDPGAAALLTGTRR